MTLTTQLDKARKDLEKTVTDLEKALADPRPLYAVVGLGDLAVGFVREAGSELATRAATFDAAALRDQAQARVNARMGSAQADMKGAPEKARTLFGEYVDAAASAYDGLAGRGQKLVTRIRNQQATEDLQSQARSTATRTKAATTTAKKSASATRRSAKAASTSAKKTASAAGDATTAGAKKVGS